MLKLLDRAAIILATATAFGIAVLPFAASAEPMPMGCVEPEHYFDVMEYNESAEPIGIFGKETGMPFEGELVKVNGVTYDVRFYSDAICVNVAEPHTKYLVSKAG